MNGRFLASGSHGGLLSRELHLQLCSLLRNLSTALPSAFARSGVLASCRCPSSLSNARQLRIVKVERCNACIHSLRARLHEISELVFG